MGLMLAEEVHITTIYTYAESNSSDTETKTNRTTLDSKGTTGHNLSDQVQDTYSDHAFLLQLELPKTTDLQHVVVIMPY